MTIKEFANKFDLSNDTLRYYKKVGLIGPIKKTKSGIRNYDENDLKRK
jgi:DNA-binding transcriptional MerR regulator